MENMITKCPDCGGELIAMPYSGHYVITSDLIYYRCDKCFKVNLYYNPEGLNTQPITKSLKFAAIFLIILILMVTFFASFMIIQNIL